MNILVPHCSDCEFHSHETSYVLGEGPIPATFMIIGEAPTKVAQKAGKPFPNVTDSGRVLNIWLSYLGIRHDDIFLTNLVKCPRRDRPSEWVQQIRNCSPTLENEIHLVEPKLVISLGNDVHKQFTFAYRPQKFQNSGESPFHRVWQRYPSSGGWGEYKGVHYFAIIHPSSAARLGKDIPDYLVSDIDRLKKCIEEITEKRQ